MSDCRPHLRPPPPPTVADIAKRFGISEAAVRSYARRYRRWVLGK